MGFLLQPALLRLRHSTNPDLLAKNPISRPHHAETARFDGLFVVRSSFRASCVRAPRRRCRSLRLELCRSRGMSRALGSCHNRPQRLDLVLFETEPPHRSSVSAENRDASDYVR